MSTGRIISLIILSIIGCIAILLPLAIALATIHVTLMAPTATARIYFGMLSATVLTVTMIHPMVTVHKLPAWFVADGSGHRRFGIVAAIKGTIGNCIVLTFLLFGSEIVSGALDSIRLAGGYVVLSLLSLLLWSIWGNLEFHAFKQGYLDF